MVPCRGRRTSVSGVAAGGANTERHPSFSPPRPWRSRQGGQQGHVLPVAIVDAAALLAGGLDENGTHRSGVCSLGGHPGVGVGQEADAVVSGDTTTLWSSRPAWRVCRVWPAAVGIGRWRLAAVAGQLGPDQGVGQLAVRGEAEAPGSRVAQPEGSTSRAGGAQQVHVADAGAAEGRRPARNSGTRPDGRLALAAVRCLGLVELGWARWPARGRDDLGGSRPVRLMPAKVPPRGGRAVVLQPGGGPSPSHLVHVQFIRIIQQVNRLSG